MRVLITQPYVPEYRRPFFDLLARLLGERHTGELRVLVGGSRGEQAARGDAVSKAPWLQNVNQRTLALAGRTLSYRSIPRADLRWADLVVHELAGSNLNALDGAVRYHDKLMLWGHAASYVRRGVPLDLAIERLLIRRSAHTFVYTEGGARFLAKHGIDLAKVSVLRNATDTKALRRARQQFAGTDPAEIRVRLGLPLLGPTALYVGGLDRDKRIDFLLTAAEEAFHIDPSFRLIVAGDGTGRASVDAGAAMGYVRYVGRVDPEAFAKLSFVADCIWMPGRVGLVAVDALVLGLPIATTEFPGHAPELEYATSAGIATFLPNEPRAFARAYLDNQPSREVPRDDVPSIEDMAERFLAGCSQARIHSIAAAARHE